MPVRLYWPWLSNFGRAAGAACVVVMDCLDSKIGHAAAQRTQARGRRAKVRVD
jgi:hypothetical protein